MSCNFGVHEGLIDLGEVVCPFCDEQISEIGMIFAVLNKN